MAAVRAMIRPTAWGIIMLRFIGGMVLGVVIGLYLGSFPAVTERLSEVGQILSWAALATLL
jgi:NhaP-type Na+/H+ or K+/H+ antiporter